MELGATLASRHRMHLELFQSSAITPCELSPGQTVSVGGGPDDALHVAGLLPSLASFELEGGCLFVSCREPMTVDGVWMPPHVRRLFVQGETLELAGGVTLRLRPEVHLLPATGGTAALARQLLGGGVGPARLPVASLTCLTGLDAGRVFYLGDETLDVGRGVHCAVRIRDRAVSRSHARIRSREGVWRVEDLQTPNGTFLNNVPLLDPQELRQGCILELGFTLLRFDEPLAASLPEPPAAPEHSEPSLAEVPMPPPPPPRNRSDWVLMATGGALAMLGSGVSWFLAAGPRLH